MGKDEGRGNGRVAQAGPIHLPGRPMKVGRHTSAFFDSLETTVAKQSDVLGVVGGNLRIRFYDGSCITLVTRGHELGIYYLPIEVPVHFELQCEEWFFDSLLDPALDADYDFEEAAVGAGLKITGDMAVFQRFTKLTKKKNFLDVRLGRS